MFAASVAVPWQSWHWTWMAAWYSAYRCVSPCTSCAKWQSTQCMPRSAWMSLRWTGLPGGGVKHLRARMSCAVGVEPSFGTTPSNFFGSS